MYLTLASNARIVMQAMTDVAFIIKNNCLLELKDCLYVLESRKDFISVSSLCKSNYSVFFNK